MIAVSKENLVISEKELIELTVKYDYSGTELNNPHFLEKGFLKQNGTYNSFCKKVDSICESWIRLKKKKGQPVMYEIKNLYKEPNQLVDDRINNGKKRTVEDVKMKEYIFNQLLDEKINDDKPYSYTTWTKQMNFMQVNEIEDEIKIELFERMYWKKEVPRILYEFNSTFEVRNKDVVKKSFIQLVRENKINMFEVPIFILVDNSISYPTKEEFDEVQERINESLKYHGVSHYEYYHNPNSERVKKVKNDVSKIYSLWKIIRAYIGVQVKVVGEQSEYAINRKEFQQAYQDRLIQLTIDRGKRVSYQVNYIQKKFYTFNTLLIMSMIGFSVDEGLLEGYRPTEEQIEALHQPQIEYAKQKDALIKKKYEFSNRIWNEEKQEWDFINDYSII